MGGRAEVAQRQRHRPQDSVSEGSNPSLRTDCRPIIEICDRGLFKLSCECGFKVHPRFRTVVEAERMWAGHASKEE